MLKDAIGSTRLPAPIAAMVGKMIDGQYEHKSELELRSELTDPDFNQRLRNFHEKLGALLKELDHGDSDTPPAA